MKWCAWLLVTLAGCASSHAHDARRTDVDLDDASAGDVASKDAASGDMASNDSHAGAKGADAARDAGVPATTPQALNPTVWIGEAEKTVTFPENMTETAPQRVVLILDALRDMAIGTVTFGSGTAPKARAQDSSYPPDFEWNPSALARYPFEGFEYSLITSHLSGDLLSLAFVPMELFRDFCAFQTSDPGPSNMPTCECNAGHCVARSIPQRRVDFRVSGDTMEGVLSGWDGGWKTIQPIIRLRRIQ